MSRVTPDEIEKMNELYLIYGTYSAVAREVGRAPTTVKRYIDPNYTAKEVKRLLVVPWSNIEMLSPINFMDFYNGKLTCKVDKDSINLQPYYLNEKPNMEGWYTIANKFDVIAVPVMNTSYQMLIARLLHASYEDYLKFCEDYFGAKVVRNNNAKYASVYFEKNARVERFVELLNKKFCESYQIFLEELNVSQL